MTTTLERLLQEYPSQEEAIRNTADWLTEQPFDAGKLRQAVLDTFATLAAEYREFAPEVRQDPRGVPRATQLSSQLALLDQLMSASRLPPGESSVPVLPNGEEDWDHARNCIADPNYRR